MWYCGAETERMHFREKQSVGVYDDWSDSVACAELLYGIVCRKRKDNQTKWRW